MQLRKWPAGVKRLASRITTPTSDDEFLERHRKLLQDGSQCGAAREGMGKSRLGEGNVRLQTGDVSQCSTR